MKFLDQYDIILASQSPRRNELISGLGINYRTFVIPDIDESFPPELKGEEIPKFISQKKAEAYRAFMKEDTLIITADTVVELDGKVYGKPKDDEDAKKMLRELSGKTHLVCTGVCISSLTKNVVFGATTKVTFAQISEDEIKYYVSHYHPLDKAGAYGVQEWIGYVAVKHLEGSYFNVMGLPVQKLYTELKRF